MPDYIYLSEAPLFRLEVPDSEPKFIFKNFVFTLDSIVHLFKLYFPEISKQNLTISISSETDSPICFRQIGLIILKTDKLHWAQAAYQFSHELCHYMIPQDVSPRLRWLEESICQMASIFFLPNLTKYWKKIDITLKTTAGNNYAEEFAVYASNDAKGALEFDIHDPLEIINLEMDCYQRSKNKHVANLLLPIFKRYPKTWGAVPYLCQVCDNVCLSAALTAWIAASPPDTHPGLEEIRSLFAD